MGSQRGDSTLLLEQSAPATPAAGFVELYVDSADKHVKQKDSTGTVTDLANGGSGTVQVYAYNGSAYAADTDVIIFVGSADPTTASGGRTQANDIWIDNSSLLGQLMALGY